MLRKEAFLYARKNLIKANIYIKDPYVSKYVTEEKITEISFVGGVGGILGLFLGFSFISAVEIFYVFFCKLVSFFDADCSKKLDRFLSQIIFNMQGVGWPKSLSL